MLLISDGFDFDVAVTSELVFAEESGPSEQCLNISITNDTCVEKDEIFTVHITNTVTDIPVKMSLLYATVQINDDDSRYLKNALFCH